MNKILASIFLMLSLSACSGALVAAEKPLSASELKQYQACDHTSDCVRVTNGCCDCANGGDTVAIHRKNEKKFRALFPCEMVMCSQRAGDCKFREPVCEAGLCKLAPLKKTK